MNLKFTESQNGRGWKGPLWVIWSNPPAKTGSPRAGCTGPCLGGSWISPEKETPLPLWAACSSALSPSEWRSSSSCSDGTSYASVCARCPLFCCWALLKSLALSSWHPPKFIYLFPVQRVVYVIKSTVRQNMLFLPVGSKSEGVQINCFIYFRNLSILLSSHFPF